MDRKSQEKLRATRKSQEKLRATRKSQEKLRVNRKSQEKLRAFFKAFKMYSILIWSDIVFLLFEQGINISTKLYSLGTFKS